MTDIVEHDLIALHHIQKLLEEHHVLLVFEYLTWTNAFVHEAEHVKVDQWQDVLCDDLYASKYSWTALVNGRYVYGQLT